MGLLDRLERALESLIEGRLPRSFAGRVHPLEVARACARQMVTQCRVGVRRRYAPNLFVVHLHDLDADALLSIEGAVLAEIREYLLEEAAERDLVLCGPLDVTLARDPALQSGSLRVEWGFLEEPTPSVADMPAVQVTPTLPATSAPGSPPPMAPPCTPPSPAARLVLRGTAGFALGLLLELRGDAMGLGRLPESDLPVPDAEVSRRHALLQRQGDRWSIEDLASRHGTLVNGMRLHGRHLLETGDEIRVGNSCLRLEWEPEPQ